MTSCPVRDPRTDHLLTPENCVLALIDYHPTQVHSIKSMPYGELVENAARVARIAGTFGLPIVLSTVNVRSGRCRRNVEDGPSCGPRAACASRRSTGELGGIRI